MLQRRGFLEGLLIAATLAVVLGAALGIGGLVTPATIVTSNVIMNVVVTSTCFISLSNSLITFTPLAPSSNTITTSNLITVSDNGGNSAATLLIAGGTWGAGTWYGSGNWIGTVENPDTNTIGITNTVYGSSSSMYYGAGFPITNTLTSTGFTILAPTQANPLQSTNIYFGMGIPPGAAADTYTTNIILENSC